MLLLGTIFIYSVPDIPANLHKVNVSICNNAIYSTATMPHTSLQQCHIQHCDNATYNTAMMPHMAL